MQRISFEILSELEKEFGKLEIGVQSNLPMGVMGFYLRFGYWEQINVSKLKEILEPQFIVEEELVDWDVYNGKLYAYNLK
tara:strand:+ start:175 stop:414 length:240 start_codon:yes stop_codon:yes gene_type:complete